MVGVIELAFIAYGFIEYRRLAAPPPGMPADDPAAVRELEWIERETAASRFDKDVAQGVRRFIVACTDMCTVPGVGATNARVCAPEFATDQLFNLSDVYRGPRHAQLSGRAGEWAAKYNELALEAAKSQKAWRCRPGEDWDGAAEVFRRSLVAWNRQERSFVAVKLGDDAPTYEFVASTRQENWPFAEAVGCAVARRFKLPSDTPLRLIDHPDLRDDGRSKASLQRTREERLVKCQALKSS